MKPSEKQNASMIGVLLLLAILLLFHEANNVGAQDNPPETPQISATWLPTETPTPQLAPPPLPSETPSIRPTPIGVCRIAPGCALMPVVMR